MNTPYEIYTDLSADLDPEIAAAYGIRMIPMSYTVGDEERLCKGFETPDTLRRFYDSQRQGLVTRTAQVTPQSYKDTFKPLMQQGVSALYLSLSSGLSGTYAASCLVADELNGRYPGARLITVDSLAATGGMGLLLEAAAKNREQGMSLEENAAWLEANRLNVCHWFMVDDLMYLKRGGRVSAATALFGTALNIKPILRIAEDGTLASFARKRGEKAVLAQLIDYYREASEHAPGERVSIVHADAPERADALKDGVLSVNPSAKVTVSYLCPVIGSHVGPGMCAIVHWGKRTV